MNGRPDRDRQPTATAAGDQPEMLSDISISDRWAPLVHDPERAAPLPAKTTQRVAASALCLIVLPLLLWAIA